MEGTTFGEVPLNIDMKLEVWDSPNSAGVVIDAVRCAKLALDNGLKGALIAPSAYFKKSPPVQYPDDQARKMVEDYIKQYGRKGSSPSKPARASKNGTHAASATAAKAVGLEERRREVAREAEEEVAGKKKAGVR
jgi:myo-inositol-1-phosphate synthase